MIKVFFPDRVINELFPERAKIVITEEIGGQWFVDEPLTTNLRADFL